MSTDVEIYALVIRFLAEVDHGWGKPYDFHALYVLDHAVPGVEEDMDARVDGTAREFPFDEALRSALQARLTNLPAVTFVESLYDVYDGSRQSPNQVRNGGGFIALGPVQRDAHKAIVGAMFYGGHLWVRWLRYTLEQEGGAWRIASSKTLAVS